MARLQYQPATKPRGFQPIQLSRAGIARMEEESNRVIRNLEQQRDATNQQRRQDLQAMQANSAYQEQEQRRNLEITELNFKNEQLAIANENKREAQEAADRSKNIDKAVNSLVDLSVTAAKVAADRTKKMIEDQVAEGAQAARQEYLNSPALQNDFAVTESQIEPSIEKLDQATMLNSAKGFESPLETAKNLAANPGRGYYWKKGYYNALIEQQTPLLVDRLLEDTEERFVDKNGKRFSGIQAVDNREYMAIVLNEVQNSLYGATGLDINSLEPGFLEPSSKFLNKYNTAKIQQASTNQTKKIYSNLEEEAINHLDQGRIGIGYRLLLKNPSVGREGALKRVFSLYSAKNADGTFRYSKEELDNTRLLGDKTILEERGNSQRYQDAIAARRKARTDFLREDQARVRTEAKEFVRQSYAAMEARFGRGNYQEDLNAIATFNKEFRERYSGGEPMPERMVLLQKSVLAGNKKDEELILAKHIKLKSLDQAAIEKFLNPTVKGQAIVAYKELQENKFGPNYAKSKKAYSTKSTDLIKRDPNVGSIQGFLVYNAMVNEHKYAYQKSIDAGVPPKVAEQEARRYVEKLVNEGINDPNSDFFRATGPLNSIVFPKLEAKYDDLARTAKEARYELLKGLLKKGVSIVDEPGALGTEEELVSSTNDYYNNNGQFRYTPGELLVHETFGIPLYAIRNAGLSALNTANGTNHRLIEPTQLEKEVFDQDPETLKLITDTDKITPKRAERAIRSGSSSIDNGPVRASMTGTVNVPLNTYAPQVSSITYDTGQPGIDVFFEDHNFPAVLPGIVKDTGYQVNANGSGYGHYLVIESIDPATGEPVDVLYGHLPTAPTQSRGQSIGLGEIIGKQGGTGSVQSYDGTIASIDFLAPAPPGSGSMTPYRHYDSLRRTIASQLN